MSLRLGRTTNNLKGGIVGLANVGKSTFFQAITKSKLGNPANYPFATIEPEESKVLVPSHRFERLCDIHSPASAVPANLTIFDIAGLTRGASKGQGLGNSFLSHIRSVDGLFQMVRVFNDEDIIHIEKSVDPIRDLEIIRDELILKDMEFVMKGIEGRVKGKKTAGAGGSGSGSSSSSNSNVSDQDITKTSKKVMDWLEKGYTVNHGLEKQVWTDTDIHVLNMLNLLSAKPSVYLANISENDYIDWSSGADGGNNKGINAIKEWVEKNSPGDSVVPISVNLEERLSGLSAEELAEEQEILGIQSNLASAIIELRRSLGLISFFTSGSDEVREWTIQKGTLAPKAAGTIHKDLEKTFILAQVTKYKDHVECNGDESKLKSQGKILQKGKDYEVEDGDVIYFKAGAGRAR